MLRYLDPECDGVDLHEGVGLILSALNDKFIWSKTSKSFEVFSEVISIQESIKMLF